MAWFSLIIAGIFEMLGVVMINRLHEKKNWQSLVLLLGAFGGSFLFLSIVMKTLPMGTAYAVWTGIGAAGTAIVGIVLFKEPADVWRLVFLTLLIGSIVGLKVFSKA